MPSQEQEELALKKALENSSQDSFFRPFDEDKHIQNFLNLVKFYQDKQRYYDAATTIIKALNDTRIYVSLDKELSSITAPGVHDYSPEELNLLLQNFNPRTISQRKTFLNLFNALLTETEQNKHLDSYEWLLKKPCYREFRDSEKESIIRMLANLYIEDKQYQKALDCLNTCRLDSAAMQRRSKFYSNDIAAIVIQIKMLQALLRKVIPGSDACFKLLKETRHLQLNLDFDVENFPDDASIIHYKQAVAAAQALNIDIPFPYQPKRRQPDIDRSDMCNQDVKSELETEPSVAIAHEESAADIKKTDFDFSKLGVVGYQREIKELIQKVFKRRLIPEALKKKLKLKPTKGVLLFGPPGTGKTLIARTIAENYFDESQVVVVNGPELKSRFVGQSAQNLRTLFNRAISNRDKTFVYIFDEIDAAFSKRSGEDNVGAKVNNDLTSQFLTILDGVDELENVIIIGTTNFKQNLDKALLRSGRLETHIEIGLPNFDDRCALFSFFINPLIELDIVEGDIDVNELAHIASNFSCADIKCVVDDTKDKILDRLVGDNFSMPDEELDLSQFSLTIDDFKQAITHLKMSRGQDLSKVSFFKPHQEEDIPTLTRSHSCSF